MKSVIVGSSFLKELLHSGVAFKGDSISIFNELPIESEGGRVTRNYLDAQRKSPKTCEQRTYGPNLHTSRFKQLREHSKVK